MARRSRPRKLPPPWLNRPTYNPPPLTGLTISDPKDTVARTITDILQPCHEYTFVEPLPDKYVCGICKSVLTEPHVTECCGQHFCKDCLETSKSKKELCPNCRHRKFNHIQYLPFEREIGTLKVHCLRKSSGCQAQVDYADRDKHDEKCDYKQVVCTNQCGKILFKKDMEYHIKKYCDLRESECETCGQVGKYKEMIPSVHRSVCPDALLKCPNYCGAQFKRKDAKSHKLICPDAIVACDFAEAGCKATLKRKELDNHMETSLKQHLSQLMTAHVAMKKEHEIIKQENAAIKKENTVIKEQFRADKRKLGRNETAQKQEDGPFKPFTLRM